MEEQFIVSARKHRPLTFNSVIGQKSVTSTLKNAVKNNHLAHAYIFCGPRGVGKTTCARIFSKTINCLNLQNDTEPCNECESCKAFANNRSFNIHELDAASNNSVEDIRMLVDKVRVPPQIGTHSVYIIDEVHMLSSAAFNAFLKTLEEPPSYALFILATTEKHKILPTILSRCQVFEFSRITIKDTVEHLKDIAIKENVKYDDESLSIIAHKADGGMRDALSIFDKVTAFCNNNLTASVVAETLNIIDFEYYFKMVTFLNAMDFKNALILYDEVVRKGFDSLLFINGISNHLRDLLVSKNATTLPLLEKSDELSIRYQAQSKEVTSLFIFEALQTLSTTESGFKTSVNQRLHVEIALIKICSINKKKT